MLILVAAGALSACAQAVVPAASARPSAATSNSNEPGRANETGVANEASGANAADGEEAVFPGEPQEVSRATAALLAQSQVELNAGDPGGAAATIERALTIAPEEALLWVELAEIRMNQGDWQLAEEMARKALTLTDENSALAARARRLIAR